MLCNSFYNKKKKSSAGITLIEMILALFVLSAGIITTALLITEAFTQTMRLPARTTSSYLAQEGLEIAERIRADHMLEIYDCLLQTPENCDDISWTENLGVENTGDTARGRVDKRNHSESLDVTNVEDDFKLYQDGAGFFTHEDVGTVSNFRRWLDAELKEDDHLRVKVTVQWRERGEWPQHGENTVEAYLDLYDYIRE